MIPIVLGTDRAIQPGIAPALEPSLGLVLVEEAALARSSLG